MPKINNEKFKSQQSRRCASKMRSIFAMNQDAQPSKTAHPICAPQQSPFLNNKKAQLGNQLMIFVFLIILIIIGGGIVFGVSMFYGKEYDFREVDAQLLNYKLKKCLLENEIDFSLPFDKLENEIFTVCKINKQVIEDNFYIKISVNDELKYQKKDVDLCILKDKNEAFPKCVQSNLKKDGKTIVILTGSTQRTKEEVA